MTAKAVNVKYILAKKEPSGVDVGRLGTHIFVNSGLKVYRSPKLKEGALLEFTCVSERLRKLNPYPNPDYQNYYNLQSCITLEFYKMAYAFGSLVQFMRAYSANVELIARYEELARITGEKSYLEIATAREFYPDAWKAVYIDLIVWRIFLSELADVYDVAELNLLAHDETEVINKIADTEAKARELIAGAGERAEAYKQKLIANANPAIYKIDYEKIKRHRRELKNIIRDYHLNPLETISPLAFYEDCIKEEGSQ